jgi:hypothetical protein
MLAYFSIEEVLHLDILCGPTNKSGLLSKMCLFYSNNSEFSNTADREKVR